MDEIHELFVLALSLVWFAGATPDRAMKAAYAIRKRNHSMGSKFRRHLPLRPQQSSLTATSQLELPPPPTHHSTEKYYLVSFGIPATCYRTENAQIPKSAGESAGKSAGKKRTAGGTAGSSAVSLLFQRNRPPSTAPSSPPSSPLFPGTLPSTLPGTFGDLGVLSPVAGRWDSNVSSLSGCLRSGESKLSARTFRHARNYWK